MAKFMHKESNMTTKAWGGRFQKALDSRVEKFNASLPFDHVLFKHDIQGSIVHAQMLARQKLISSDEAELICSGLEQIQSELQQGLHAMDTACEDIHMLIEHLLVQKIGMVGKKLHTGRSRNDQVALDLKLYCRENVIIIQNLLATLLQTLKDLSTQHATHIMPGYTHLQEAQPIFLGQYFDAYHAMFQRDATRIQDWFKRMNLSPLGAGALAGSGLPLDREWIAQRLGFENIVENTLDAVSDRDYVIELCSFASILMVHLSRLSEDLILWSTQEFNFVMLDDAFATGSSLMPQKKNPDVLELVRGKSGRIFGHLIAILTVMKALPLAYNKDMQEDKEVVFDTLKTLMACLEIMPSFLSSLQFNTKQMEHRVNKSFMNATNILEKLVLKGMAFRDAHHTVGQWVQMANAQNKTLLEIMQEQESE